MNSEQSARIVFDAAPPLPKARPGTTPFGRDIQHYRLEKPATYPPLYQMHLVVADKPYVGVLVANEDLGYDEKGMLTKNVVIVLDVLRATHRLLHAYIPDNTPSFT